MKKCPHCGKEMHERAVKCKYCKKYLDEETKEIVNTKKSIDKSDELYKQIAVIILGIGGSIILLFWLIVNFI